jgi:hypothetical protein
MNRILLAGIVGGIVMFVWSAISHMVLQIGEAGISTLPQEETLMNAMRETVREPGFYFFPGMDMSRQATPEETAAWEAKVRSGPAGILVVDPDGREPMPPSMLIIELLSNIAAATLAAFVLVKTAAAYGSRIVDALIFGLVAWFSISVSYWNWYKFPGALILSEGIDQVVGWALAGIAMALILKGYRTPEPPRAGFAPTGT